MNLSRTWTRSWFQPQVFMFMEAVPTCLVRTLFPQRFLQEKQGFLLVQTLLFSMLCYNGCRGKERKEYNLEDL